MHVSGVESVKYVEIDFSKFLYLKIVDNIFEVIVVVMHAFPFTQKHICVS